MLNLAADSVRETAAADASSLADKLNRISIAFSVAGMELLSAGQHSLMTTGTDRSISALSAGVLIVSWQRLHNGIRFSVACVPPSASGTM
jgi:hypothetical protein